MLQKRELNKVLYIVANVFEKFKCTPHIVANYSPLLYQVYTWGPVRLHSHLINSIRIGSCKVIIFLRNEIGIRYLALLNKVFWLVLKLYSKNFAFPTYDVFTPHIDVSYLYSCVSI